MKNIIATLLILITISLTAQEIKVKDVKYKFSSGEKFALEVNIHSDDIKDVMRAFKKEAEKDAGTIVAKKGELFLDNTIIKSISENKIDVYAVVKKSKDGTSKLIACFEINNEYIIPKSKEYKNAEKFMLKLAKEISVIVIEKELKKEEKELENIKEKIESKKNKNSSLDEDIKKREKNIEGNKKELKDVSSEVKKVTKDINNGKGKLDKLAKQKEKLDKKFEKLTKQISRDEGAIKDNHKKIEKNKKDIESLEKKKAGQEKVVEKVKKKLSDVK
jgi:chromosome segregation ATPase